MRIAITCTLAMPALSLPQYQYEDLNWRRLERALERDGEVRVLLNAKQAAALRDLIAMHARIEHMRAVAPALTEKVRAIAAAAALVVRLSMRHGRLFEVQRLALVLSNAYEMKELNANQVLFRFVSCGAMPASSKETSASALEQS